MTAVLVFAGSLLAAPIATAPPAQADGIHQLPITTLNNILVDQAHGHVFLSAPSQIAVTDLDGVPTTTIPASGAQHMVLSQDGTKVYAALGGGHAVGIIDTSTLTMTTMSTGASTCPFDLAETAGRLWYSYGCSNVSKGSIGYFDLADSATNHPNVRTGYSYVPYIESSPALPGELVSATRNISPGTVDIATINEGDTASLTTRVSTWAPVNRGVRVSPDGTRIVVSGLEQKVFLTSDLSEEAPYHTAGPSPVALAIRSDGMVAAGTTVGNYPTDIYLFEAGSRTWYRTYSTSDVSHLGVLAPNGLAFGATRLYAVIDPGPGLLLRVITPRKASAVSITASRPTYNFDANARLTIHLTTDSSNKQVAIYAKPYGRAEKLIKTGNVDGSGNLVATLPVKRRTTFRVAYAGDVSHDPAQSTLTVAVRAKVTPRVTNHFARSGTYYLFHPTKDAVLIGLVAPNHAGDCLNIRAEYYDRRVWRPYGSTGCIRMTQGSYATGLLDSKDLVGVKVRMRAMWPGDTENAAQASAWRYVKFVR